MRNFTKRQRRGFIALVSLLLFWLAYDIWDHSRHPVFWGLSYLIRVPVPHADTTVTESILSKIHSEGFFISKGSMTNVEKLNVSRLEPGTTNLIRYSEVRTNTYDGFRLSNGGSNSAFLHKAPRDGDDLIRLSSNSLLMVNMDYFNGYGTTGWESYFRLIVLDSGNGSTETTLFHSSSRNRGNCTLSRDVNGLIFCKLATGFDYVYAAIDEKMTRMRGEIWFVDRRGYWDDNGDYKYLERDLSAIIYSWELAALDLLLKTKTMR